MFAFAQRFLRSENGATALEYGLIVALVSVAAIIALDTLGGSLTTIFELVSSELADAAANAGS